MSAASERVCDILTLHAQACFIETDELLREDEMHLEKVTLTFGSKIGGRLPRRLTYTREAYERAIKEVKP